MCERSREFRSEFSIGFRGSQDYEGNFRELMNHHVAVSFPGLENGFFPSLKKTLSYSKHSSASSAEKTTYNITDNFKSKGSGSGNNSME